MVFPDFYFQQLPIRPVRTRQIKNTLLVNSEGSTFCNKIYCNINQQTTIASMKTKS